MGAVLAKFRKEKSSAEILEKIENDITRIEKFSLTTQQKQKRLIGNFLVISIGLYTIGFLIFYFVFFPPTWPERITYSVPLLIFPLLIFLLRRVLALYFQRTINKNSTKLVSLRAEKKKILEEVMDKETYNVASKLLSKYGDKSYALKPVTATALSATPQPRKPQESRIQNQNPNTSLLSQATGVLGAQQLNQMKLSRSLTNVNNNQSAISPLTPINTSSGGVLRQRNVPAAYSNMMSLQKPRPYPIINQNSQGILEKMVDYLIGDGPQNRYALICKECFSHNGMARQEEFDYATFRCAFCNVLNPSRKSRPVAPKLPTATPTGINNRIAAVATGDSSDSSESSADSSDESAGRKSSDTTAAVPQQPTIKLDTEFSGSKANIAAEPSEENETNGPSEPEEPNSEEPSKVEEVVEEEKDVDKENENK